MSLSEALAEISFEDHPAGITTAVDQAAEIIHDYFEHLLADTTGETE